MSLQLSELRTLQTDFGVHLDNYKGTGVTSAQQNAQINWALRNLGRRLNLFDPKITFTLVAGTAIYNIRDTTTPVVSARVVKALQVIINNTILTDWKGERGLWSLDQLERINPSWRVAGNNTPYMAVQYTWNKLLLNPPPTSGTVSSGSNFISGIYLPAALSQDTDVPDIPEELHECIAYYAAQHAALPTASEQVQFAKLQAYNQEWYDNIMDYARMNDNLMQGNWFDTGNVYSAFIAT